MRCDKCKEGKLCCFSDGEFVCENCGSAYELNYIGMYDEGSSELIEEGFESKEWLKKLREANNNGSF